MTGPKISGALLDLFLTTAEKKCLLKIILFSKGRYSLHCWT